LGSALGALQSVYRVVREELSGKRRASVFYLIEEIAFAGFLGDTAKFGKFSPIV